ncbi:unnamed protein product [Trypanosoma congolense IL3000]|uniref:WGS project CAEQ00000000 data, annotated contig 1442 n=1 Tax=Trypanosoma congolense (strain IL3000) TaxID=1068625 RepID=F9W6A6_TRYCI|nr:unnamed protein product [Trypanosoma congolense IL3000]
MRSKTSITSGAGGFGSSASSAVFAGSGTLEPNEVRRCPQCKVFGCKACVSGNGRKLSSNARRSPESELSLLPSDTAEKDRGFDGQHAHRELLAKNSVLSGVSRSTGSNYSLLGSPNKVAFRSTTEDVARKSSKRVVDVAEAPRESRRAASSERCSSSSTPSTVYISEPGMALIRTESLKNPKRTPPSTKKSSSFPVLPAVSRAQRSTKSEYPLPTKPYLSTTNAAACPLAPDSRDAGGKPTGSGDRRSTDFSSGSLASLARPISIFGGSGAGAAAGGGPTKSGCKRPTVPFSEPVLPEKDKGLQEEEWSGSVVALPRNPFRRPSSGFDSRGIPESAEALREMSTLFAPSSHYSPLPLLPNSIQRQLTPLRTPSHTQSIRCLSGSSNTEISDEEEPVLSNPPERKCLSSNSSVAFTTISGHVSSGMANTPTGHVPGDVAVPPVVEKVVPPQQRPFFAGLAMVNSGMRRNAPLIIVGPHSDVLIRQFGDSCGRPSAPTKSRAKTWNNAAISDRQVTGANGPESQRHLMKRLRPRKWRRKKFFATP